VIGISKEEMRTFRPLPSIIEKYVSQITENDLNVKRNSETWSIKEHVYHIAGVQKMLLQRMKTIKSSPAPVIEPFFPLNEKALDKKYSCMSDAFCEYKQLRKEQISLIKRCSQADLDKKALHKEYKIYSIPIMVKHMIFHEFWHMHRIEEIWLVKDEYFK
jgi:hypothetical protein